MPKFIKKYFLVVTLAGLIFISTTAIIAINSLVNTSGSGYYVSTWGSDSNTGTKNSPFKTIQKCAIIAISGETCNIKGGVYRESVLVPNSGVTFQPYYDEINDTDKVTINSTEALEKNTWQKVDRTQEMTWLPADHNTYKVDASDINPDELEQILRYNSTTQTVSKYQKTIQGQGQLFIDSEMATEARWPNIGDNISNPKLASFDQAYNSAYFVNESDAKTEAYNCTTTAPIKCRYRCLPNTNYQNDMVTADFLDNALPSDITDADYEGSYITMGLGPQWRNSTGTVGSKIANKNWRVSYSSWGCSDLFTYKINEAYTPNHDNKYYLWGKLRYLDSEKEWFYDKNSKQLYFWFPGESQPNSFYLEYKKRKDGLKIIGQDNITVKNLDFFGGSIQINNESSTNLAENNLLTGVTMEYTSHQNYLPNGVYATDFDSSVERYITLVPGVTPNGIFASPTKWPVEVNQTTGAITKYTSVDGNLLYGKNNKIDDCFIRFSAYNGFRDFGEKNTIQNCTILNSNYAGVDGAGLRVKGLGGNYLNNIIRYTASTVLFLTGAGHNAINNHLTDGGLALRDFGIIYGFLNGAAQIKVADAGGLNAGQVAALTIVNKGYDYTTTPTLKIVSTPGNGSGATAIANMVDGRINSVTITNGGTGYNTAPQIIVEGGDRKKSLISNNVIKDYWNSTNNPPGALSKGPVNAPGFEHAGIYFDYYYVPGIPAAPTNVILNNNYIQNMDLGILFNGSSASINGSEITNNTITGIKNLALYIGDDSGTCQNKDINGNFMNPPAKINNNIFEWGYSPQGHKPSTNDYWVVTGGTSCLPGGNDFTASSVLNSIMDYKNNLSRLANQVTYSTKNKFLAIPSSTNAVDKGIINSTNATFAGSAPDIGAFESGLPTWDIGLLKFSSLSRKISYHCNDENVNSTTTCYASLPESNVDPKTQFNISIGNANFSPNCSISQSTITCNNVPTGSDKGSVKIKSKINNIEYLTNDVVNIN